MKLGKLIIEFRRAGGPKLVEEVFDALTDPEGEARMVIAKMARSAAKDFIDAEGGRILADLTAELEKRKAATLAELGSAGRATPLVVVAPKSTDPAHVFHTDRVDDQFFAECKCGWKSALNMFEELAASDGRDHVKEMTK